MSGDYKERARNNFPIYSAHVPKAPRESLLTYQVVRASVPARNAGTHY
jgi:hypothetical protein